MGFICNYYKIAKFIKYGLIFIGMTIDKTIQKIVLSIGIPVVGWIGGLTGYNFYAHHNVSYETPDKKVVQKADGIIDYTSVEINKEDGSIEITRDHFPNWRSYKDKDRDGNVDEINRRGNLFVRGSHYSNFDREKHLKQYPIVFQEADRDFRQQIKRFKPYINR